MNNKNDLNLMKIIIEIYQYDGWNDAIKYDLPLTVLIYNQIPEI